MKELVVLSGKGGTGKTTLVASLAGALQRKIIVDCDVDAPDLTVLLEPKTGRVFPFTGGKKARIDQRDCNGCGECLRACRFGAILENNGLFEVDPIRCEGCGVCKLVCPSNAVTLEDQRNGEYIVADSRFGSFVYGALDPGEENSGKLVSLVKKAARGVAEQKGLGFMLVDGPPGVGCPAISSLSGASYVLVVAEPTPSGLHDACRLFSLVARCELPAGLVVNKACLSLGTSEALESKARDFGFETFGRLHYDNQAILALNNRKTILEFTKTGIGEDMLRLANKVRNAFYEQGA